MKKLFTLIVFVAMSCHSIAVYAAGEVITQGKAVNQVQETVTHALSAEQVKNLQAALAEKGFYKGAANGAWSEAVVNALHDYQTSEGQVPGDNLSLEALAELGVSIPAGQEASTTDEKDGVKLDITRTVTEYETTTIEKFDIRTDGNGPNARGPEAFLE